MLKQREMPEDTTVCWASGHYLTNELPDNWMDMDEADVLDFIEEHVCEDYEYFCLLYTSDAADIYSV